MLTGSVRFGVGLDNGVVAAGHVSGAGADVRSIGRSSLMANPDNLKVLQQGVGVWNAWGRKEPSVVPHLVRAMPMRPPTSGTTSTSA